MRKIEYNKASDFNYTYDGRTLYINGLHNKELTEVYVPPEIDGRPVEVIGNAAFAFNHRIKRIVLPDSVVTVENSAFKGCDNLVDAVLSRELQVIGALAFSGCSKLKRLTVSNHTDRVEMNSFRDCTSLETVVVKLREFDPEEYRRIYGQDSEAVEEGELEEEPEDEVPVDYGGYVAMERSMSHFESGLFDGGMKHPPIKPNGTWEFQISGETEEAIWLFLRAIMRSCEMRNFAMDKYDATYMEMANKDARYRIAVSRLKEPFDMSVSMEKTYRDFLKGMVPEIILQDRVDRLTTLGGMECINLDSMDEYMDVACRVGGGCVAYLLEHKRRHTGMIINDFAL